MIHIRHIGIDGTDKGVLSSAINTLDIKQLAGWVWIDMDNAASADELAVYQALNIHPLALQDISRERHPPKYECFGDFHLFLMRGLARTDEISEIYFEPIQIGILLGKNFVVTKHCGSPSVLKIGSDTPHSRPEVLVFELLRLISARYLNWILNHEDRVQEMEAVLLEKNDESILEKLVASKKELRKLQRNFDYMTRLFRQLNNQGLNSDYPANCSDLNDLFEKYDRLSSMTLMFYDQTGDLIDGYISMASHRLNKTMQILTVITAVFVPLSFLAGIYGMNFDTMPELHVAEGYYILLGVMASVAVTMLTIFKKLKWF